MAAALGITQRGYQKLEQTPRKVYLLAARYLSEHPECLPRPA